MGLGALCRKSGGWMDSSQSTPLDCYNTRTPKLLMTNIQHDAFPPNCWPCRGIEIYLKKLIGQ